MQQQATILEIPISPLSKRILSYQYPDGGVLKLSAYDYFYDIIQNQNFSHCKPMASEDIAEYSESVRIKVAFEKSAEKIDIRAVSRLLHAYHIAYIITYITSRIEMNCSVLESIRSVSKKYNIDDTVWSQEAIVKRLQREKKKSVEKLEKKGFKPVQVESNFLRKGKTTATRYTVNFLEIKVRDLIEQHPALVRDCRGKISRAKLKALRAYTYSEIGHHRIEFVVKEIGLKKSTAYHMINHVRNYLSKHQS